MKNRLNIWSNNPTPGCISGQNYNMKRYRHPKVHCSTIDNSRNMETTYMSTKRRTDEGDAACIHSGILLSHSKGWDYSICSHMDMSRNYHTKGNKADQERQITDFANMRNLQKWHKWISLQNRNRLTDIENKHGFQIGKLKRDTLGVLGKIVYIK